jgi:hypothetical protein
VAKAKKKSAAAKPSETKAKPKSAAKTATAAGTAGVMGDPAFKALVQWCLPAVNNVRVRMRQDPIDMDKAMDEIATLAKKL